MIFTDDFLDLAANRHFFRWIENSNMQKINLFDFYELGKALANLKTVFHNEELSDGEKLHYVQRCQYLMGCFLASTKKVKAKESIEIAKKLLDALNNYFRTLALSDSSTDVFQKEFAPKLNINSLIEEFEESFEKKAEHLGSFLVAQKGIYDTELLISDASEHFEPEVLKHLPDTAICDFREAGKCLAFECPTAMAYHILRAIEAVILKYYETHTGHAWEKKDIGWWFYIDALKNLNPNPVPKSITQRLNEIRKYERNPIAHPGFFLELKDAKPFFDLCSGVIPLMAQEIEKLEAAKKES